MQMRKNGTFRLFYKYRMIKEIGKFERNLNTSKTTRHNDVNVKIINNHAVTFGIGSCWNRQNLIWQLSWLSNALKNGDVKKYDS